MDVVLSKAMGVGRYGESQVAGLARCQAQLESAALRAIPDLVDQLAASSEPLRRQWDSIGNNLLHQVGVLTDPRLIVEQATVDLVYPAIGGGGIAHLPYNTARIEVLEPEPNAELPEVARVAWLVAQLNTDLPMISEALSRKHHNLLARLALLPAILNAVEELELVRPGACGLGRAAQLWQVHRDAVPELTDVLSTWWESYLDLRPTWNVALAALHQMLAEPAISVGCRCSQ